MLPSRSTGFQWLAVLAAVFTLACGDEPERNVTPTPLPGTGKTAPADASPQTSAGSPAEGRPGAAPGMNEPKPVGRETMDQFDAEVDLPQTYPSDAPVYPGTRPSEAFERPDGRLSVVFSSPDSPDQVMEFMIRELSAARWEVGPEQDLKTGRLVQGTKGDRLISVLLSRVGDESNRSTTMIAIAVDP